MTLLFLVVMMLMMNLVLSATRLFRFQAFETFCAENHLTPNPFRSVHHR